MYMCDLLRAGAYYVDFLKIIINIDEHPCKHVISIFKQAIPGVLVGLEISGTSRLSLDLRSADSLNRWPLLPQSYNTSPGQAGSTDARQMLSSPCSIMPIFVKLFLPLASSIFKVT